MTGGIRPLAVIGPTASGKSELALDLAQHCGGEIVNVDAMQLYSGMDIGTAKLNIAERKGIPHHQLDTLAVTETASVARYQQSARADIDNILQRGLTPIIVGGSMMYVQSLVDDWAFPATDAVVRSAWESRLKSEGIAALHAVLKEVDPIAAQTILPTDGRRIVRALEVIELTGQPFAASAPVKGEPRWGALLLGVDRKTEELDQRIEIRTAQMFSDGLVDEVESLIEVGLRAGVTASRAIGYAQVLAALDGEYGMDSAQEITTQGTKRYVRRQRSWFRRDSRVCWLDASGGELLTQALGVIEQNHDLRS